MMMRDRLPRRFYSRASPVVARELLGALVHRIRNGQELICRIVEVEAYEAYDEAAHCFHGKTDRNAVMFGEAGHAYVYFTYGMHYCFNTTTNPVGTGGGVLIRGMEPIVGIEEIRAARPRARRDRDLLSGPGKICQALGIDRELNGTDLVRGTELFITEGGLQTEERIGVSTRIGISVAQDYLWRFYIEGNHQVSTSRPVRGRVCK